LLAGALARLPAPRLEGVYLQSGQQPVALTFDAAAAVVASSATNAAASPNSLAFILVLLSVDGPFVRRLTVGATADWRVKASFALDLQPDLKVFY
jgi:hypothetical protein